MKYLLGILGFIFSVIGLNYFSTKSANARAQAKAEKLRYKNKLILKESKDTFERLSEQKEKFDEKYNSYRDKYPADDDTDPSKGT